MKNQFLLILLFAFSNLVDAQTWERLSPTPILETLYDIAFADSLNVWVVGNNGAILHSTNRGESWIEEDRPTSIRLNAIQFINENEGWIVGGQYDTTMGITLHTIDAGNTWTIDTLPFQLSDVFFVNDQKGWVLSTYGRYFVTENGGLDWEQKSFASLTFPIDPYSSLGDLVSIHFINELTGWIIGSEGGVVKTNDGGDTWETNMIPNVIIKNTEVFFLDSLTGWISGYADTANSGSPIDPPELSSTIDGGQTWVTGPAFSYFTGVPNVNSVVFENDSLGWCVGTDSPIYGLNHYISQTNNGGGNWIRDEFFQGNVGSFEKVVVDRGEVWVVGGRGIIINKKFNDEDWTIKASVYKNLNDVEYLTLEKLIAVGDRGTIINSFDGGISWDNDTQFTNTTLLDIHFIDENIGYIVGDLGEIWHTQNGGDTWEQQSSNVNVLLQGVDFVSPNLGWVVGDSSTILRTLDGGQTWVKQITDSIRILQSVDFVNADFGCAVGDKGYYLTQDGGKEWQFFDSENTFANVQFLNQEVGYMSMRPRPTFFQFLLNADSSSRYLLQTIDGGLSWEQLPDSTAVEIFGGFSLGGLNDIQIFDTLNRILIDQSGVYVRDEENLDLLRMETGILDDRVWQGIDCYDINNCIVVGANGNIGKIKNDNIILSTNSLSLDSSKVLVFPNPNYDGHIFCKNIKGFFQMQLYDFQGRLIQKSTLDENLDYFEFDLPKLSNGVYWLHFIGENKFATEKVIFQK